MRNLLILALAITLGGQSVLAETYVVSTSEGAPRRSVWWKASLAALATATVVDAHSSWGRMEANPLLRNSNGRFGMQGIAFKAAIFGGVAGAQYLLTRKNPKAEKYGAVTNFVLSGVLTGAAIANHQRAARSSSLVTTQK